MAIWKDYIYQRPMFLSSKIWGCMNCSTTYWSHLSMYINLKFTSYWWISSIKWFQWRSSRYCNPHNSFTWRYVTFFSWSTPTYTTLFNTDFLISWSILLNSTSLKRRNVIHCNCILFSTFYLFMMYIFRYIQFHEYLSISAYGIFLL